MVRTGLVRVNGSFSHPGLASILTWARLFKNNDIVS